MEDNLIFILFVDNLNLLCNWKMTSTFRRPKYGNLNMNGRHPKFFKWKTTSNFQMEDNLNFFQLTMTSIFIQMEDNLNILLNGR